MLQMVPISSGNGSVLQTRTAFCWRFWLYVGDGGFLLTSVDSC